MNKQAIRQLAKNTRFNRTLKDILNLNNSIKKNLFSYFDFSKHKNILIYLSCTEKGEVDTWNLIKELKDRNIYTPIIGPSNELYLTKYDGIFTRNDYGIFECPGERVQERERVHIDIAILPMLAFDIEGNRIGYGKGYFDSLLSKWKNVSLIGLCMDSPWWRCAWKPDIHDIPLNYAVTPDKIYKF